MRCCPTEQTARAKCTKVPEIRDNTHPVLSDPFDFIKELRRTQVEQDLSLRGTVSQGEVSCGLVLKSSGRNIDNGDSCSTPIRNVLNVRILPIKSDLYSVSVNPNETAARHLF